MTDLDKPVWDKTGKHYWYNGLIIRGDSKIGYEIWWNYRDKAVTNIDKLKDVPKIVEQLYKSRGELVKGNKLVLIQGGLSEDNN